MTKTEFEKIRNAFDIVKEEITFLAKEIERLNKENELLMAEIEKQKFENLTSEKNHIYRSQTAQAEIIY
ncbi:MAG: hypothetical protein ACOCXG_04400 [Nanoarchaeota archaeon]